MSTTRESAKPFKANLTRPFVLMLRSDLRPVGVDSKGNFLFAANPEKRGYIVWDTHSQAPAGFGVRVDGKKTYIIRRKVNGKSIQPKVGNVSDFLTIDDARKKAADLALRMTATGKNPNVESRSLRAAEAVLGDVFREYRTNQQERENSPAKPETLKVMDKVIRSFNSWDWLNRRVSDISIEEVRRKFKEGKVFPSANEQRFRWAIAAVNWKIQRELYAAHAENRAPTLTFNPFGVLVEDKVFRGRRTLEKLRQEQSVRNPLAPSRTLGPFLEAAWSKRTSNDNETGVHYLILMLLFGCRKSEHAQCRWGELLLPHGPTAVGRKTTSHVWLHEQSDYITKGPYIFFHNTKNGLNHRLPIGPMTLELLRRRQVSAAQEAIRRGFESKSRPFVFPAKSKFSRSGHYSDATDLISRIKDEVGLHKLSQHDLRRSFGTVMTSIDVPEAIKKRFFNHSEVPFEFRLPTGRSYAAFDC